MRSSARLTQHAARAATNNPIVSVTRARATSPARPATIPIAVAAIGSASGLTAIAPTIRIWLSSITPKPAMTPAVTMNAR